MDYLFKVEYGNDEYGKRQSTEYGNQRIDNFVHHYSLPLLPCQNRKQSTEECQSRNNSHVGPEPEVCAHFINAIVKGVDPSFKSHDSFPVGQLSAPRFFVPDENVPVCSHHTRHMELVQDLWTFIILESICSLHSLDDWTVVSGAAYLTDGRCKIQFIGVNGGIAVCLAIYCILLTGLCGHFLSFRVQRGYVKSVNGVLAMMLDSSLRCATFRMTE